MSNRIKLFFSTSVALGIAIAGGCSSSSTDNTPGKDGGTDGSMVGDDGSETADGAVHCQIGTSTGCSTGETCCFDPAALLGGGGIPDITMLGALTTGYCTTACTTGFSLGCTSGAACGGQKCCATASVPAALLDAAAGFDGNFPAFDGNFPAFDASAVGDTSGTGLTVACAATCAGQGQIQLCSDVSECAPGLICSSGMGLTATFFNGIKGCIPVPDAGAGTKTDAGTPDATADAATTVDAGTPDAGVDAN